MEKFVNFLNNIFNSSLPLDSVLVIDFICAKIKSCVNTTTKSDWYSHRLEIIRCWSVMQILLPKIHRHRTQRVALEICQTVTMLMVFRPCNSKWWQWIKHNQRISINRHTFNRQKCSTMITTTITTMVRQIVAVVALLLISSMRHSWKFRIALKRSEQNAYTHYADIVRTGSKSIQLL